MAFKIRILAMDTRPRGPAPRLVYRAEAFEEGGFFPERKWACGHDHETAEHAFHCGQAWLARNPKID